MRLIIRNFIRIFQRFKLAMTLNILGFSVAFTAFMIILMQWQYDMTFDKDTPNSDCIYRVDALGLFDMERCALCSQPMAETFTQSSPHIQGGGLMMPWPYPAYFTFEDSQGERQTYKEIRHLKSDKATYYKALALQIREYMRVNHLSQRECAAALGMSPARVSQLLSEKREKIIK